MLPPAERPLRLCRAVPCRGSPSPRLPHPARPSPRPAARYRHIRAWRRAVAVPVEGLVRPRSPGPYPVPPALPLAEADAEEKRRGYGAARRPPRPGLYLGAPRGRAAAARVAPLQHGAARPLLGPPPARPAAVPQPSSRPAPPPGAAPRFGKAARPRFGRTGNRRDSPIESRWGSEHLPMGTGREPRGCVAEGEKAEGSERR